MERELPEAATTAAVAAPAVAATGADEDRWMVDWTTGAAVDAAAATEAAVLVADYEPRRYDRWRAANPYLADRRVDLF